MIPGVLLQGQLICRLLHLAIRVRSTETMNNHTTIRLHRIRHKDLEAEEEGSMEAHLLRTYRWGDRRQLRLRGRCRARMRLEAGDLDLVLVRALVGRVETRWMRFPRNNVYVAVYVLRLVLEEFPY